MRKAQFIIGFFGGRRDLLLCLALSLLLSACLSTPKTKFYVLGSMSDSGQLQDSVELTKGPSIGVGPVRIPDYLDRAQIVTRSNPNSLDVADFHRWAEPLDSSISRVVAENLSRLLSTENVAVYPWPPSNHVDYQVQLTLVRFDGVMKDNVALDARWTVLVENGKHIRLKNNSSIREPVEGESYESLVSAQSRALASLSREIASAIKSASDTGSNL